MVVVVLSYTSEDQSSILNNRPPRSPRHFLQADFGLKLFAKGVFHDVLQAIQVPDGDGAPGTESSGILAAGLLNRRTERQRNVFHLRI